MDLEINFDSKIWTLAICTFPKILSNSKNSQIFEQSFFVENYKNITMPKKFSYSYKKMLYYVLVSTQRSNHLVHLGCFRPYKRGGGVILKN